MENFVSVVIRSVIGGYIVDTPNGEYVTTSLQKAMQLTKQQFTAAVEDTEAKPLNG